jgi:hypothetical protein
LNFEEGNIIFFVISVVLFATRSCGDNGDDDDEGWKRAAII